MAFLSEKVSDFENTIVLCIGLKHVTWKFRICNYFSDFTNTLMILLNKLLSDQLGQLLRVEELCFEHKLFYSPPPSPSLSFPPFSGPN